MDRVKEIIGHLQIVRTWAAVDLEHGTGIDGQCLDDVVRWMDDAIRYLEENRAGKAKRCADCRYVKVDNYDPERKRYICQRPVKVKRENPTAYCAVDAGWYCKDWKER